jgi:hypothetical protein
MTPLDEPLRRITITWNRENPEETEAARETFIRYIRRGWLAFKITSDGKKKLIFRFDPSAEKIQLVPIVEGG